MRDKVQFSVNIIRKDGEVQVDQTISDHPISTLSVIFENAKAGLYSGEITHFIVERRES